MMKINEDYFDPCAVEAILCTNAREEKYIIVLRSGRMLNVRMTYEEAERLAGRALDFMRCIRSPNVSDLDTEE